MAASCPAKRGLAVSQRRSAPDLPSVSTASTPASLPGVSVNPQYAITLLTSRAGAGRSVLTRCKATAPRQHPTLPVANPSAGAAPQSEHQDWQPLNGCTAVISGAGPAGCTLAMHLARAGWRVRVYEKRPEPGPATSSRQRSWVLAMYPRGIRPVAAVAEVPLLRERAYKGLVVGAGKPGSKPIVLERTGVLMDRTLLATSLLDAARGQYGSRVEFAFDTSLEAVDFRRRVATVRPLPTTIATITTTGSTTAAAPAVSASLGGEPTGLEEMPYDLLVGADGSSSTLRVLLAEAYPGQYDTTVLGSPGAAGVSCYKSVYGLPPLPEVEAWAPDSAVPVSERLQGEFFLVLSGGGKGFMSMCRDIDGSYCGYLAAKEEVFAGMRSREDYLELLPQTGPQLPAEWLPLLADKLMEAPQSRFPVMRALSRFWSPGGVVLVGDAAHTVTPSLGQGLNSALEDCELLAAELRGAGEQGHDAIDAALRRFSDSRVPDVRALQELELMQSSSLTPLSAAASEPLPLLQLLVRKWVVVQYSGLALLGTVAATALAANRKKKQQQQEEQEQEMLKQMQTEAGGSQAAGSSSSSSSSGDGGRAASEVEAEAAARSDLLGRQLDATYVRSPPMYELLRGHMPYREMLVRVYGMAVLGTGATVVLLYGILTAAGGFAARVLSG